MQMQHMRASCLLVQVVDVLGDDIHLMPFALQFCHQPVTLARLGSQQFAPARVVEVGHQFGVTCPSLWSGHIFHVIVVPQSVAVTEGAESAFCAHACACQYHYSHLFLLCL